MDIYNLLRKDLYEIYPIGIPHIYRSYNGYKQFISLKEKWILDLDNSKSNISKLNLFLEEFAIQNLFLFSLNYFSEVGFKFILTIKEEKGFSQNIVIFISPIIKYFTVYVEEISIVRKFDVEQSRENVNTLSCYYFKSNGNLELKKTLDFIIDKIKKIFDNYNFIHHEPLMTLNILGGCPYSSQKDNFELAKEYLPLFEFFFGSCNALSNSIICS